MFGKNARKTKGARVYVMKLRGIEFKILYVIYESANFEDEIFIRRGEL